jgi:Putative Flp pilus-assembly TadE/G-like
MRTIVRQEHRSQGQILVVFAGGLIVLLAITALVIDLGFVFMIKRQEQNAIDPGAIAAARYIHTGAGGAAQPALMRSAACFYARQNGFFPLAADDTGCSPANDPNGSTLTVNYPPSAQAGSFAGSSGYVEVILSRQHQSFIAGFLGLRQFAVSSSAIAAFNSPGQSNPNSLIALDPGNTCSSGVVHGGGTVNIHPVSGAPTGGFVQINATCSTGATNSTCEQPGNGALDVKGGATLTSPQTNVSGTCKRGSVGGLTGPLTEGAVQIGDPLADLPPPRFSDYPDGNCQNGTTTHRTGPFSCTFNNDVTLNPGVYYGGWTITNKTTITLTAGLYIIAGGGIKIQGSGEITSVAGAAGAAPVMIFNTGCPTCTPPQTQGNVTLSTQSSIDLRPIATGPYRGIVLWNDGNSNNPSAEVDLLGGTNLNIGGTIYSPKGLVKVDGGGSAAGTAAIQIIAWNFDVGGNAGLDMPYDPNGLFHFDLKGLVR